MSNERNETMTSETSNDNQAVLTVSELAMRWKCTRRSVLLKIRNGELQAFRIGTRAFRVAFNEVRRVERSRAA